MLCPSQILLPHIQMALSFYFLLQMCFLNKLAIFLERKEQLREAIFVRAVEN